VLAPPQTHQTPLALSRLTSWHAGCTCNRPLLQSLCSCHSLNSPSPLTLFTHTVSVRTLFGRAHCFSHYILSFSLLSLPTHSLHTVSPFTLLAHFLHDSRCSLFPHSLSPLTLFTLSPHSLSSLTLFMTLVAHSSHSLSPRSLSSHCLPVHSLRSLSLLSALTIFSFLTLIAPSSPHTVFSRSIDTTLHTHVFSHSIKRTLLNSLC